MFRKAYTSWHVEGKGTLVSVRRVERIDITSGWIKEESICSSRGMAMSVVVECRLEDGGVARLNGVLRSVITSTKEGKKYLKRRKKKKKTEWKNKQTN